MKNKNSKYLNNLKQLKKIFDENYKLSKKKHNFLSLSQPSFDFQEIKGVIDSLFSGWISLGPNVRKFERDFSKKIGCKYGIAVNSGSSANLIAIQALKKKFKLKNNDEVIIPASTFATVAMPILQSGLVPVYVDIDIKSLNIDPIEIKKAISSKTKVIMPVHTLGLSANMKEINKIAKKNNLIVLEDCCEAHGSTSKGKYAGSWGNISCFSFFVAHNITTGEGGMILTNDKELKNICLSLREFGRINQRDLHSKRFYSDRILKDYDKRYVFKEIGYNLRMTDLAGAIGIIQLKKLFKLNKKRISNAKYLYKKIIKKYSDFFDLPGINFDESHSFYTFPIIIKKGNLIKRKILCEFLEKHKIQTRPMMAGCLPDQPAFRNKPGRIVGNLKNSRFVRDNLFFIGIHPELQKENFDYFIKILDKFFNK